VQHLEVTPYPMYTLDVKNHRTNWSANPMGTAPGGPQTVSRVLTRTQYTHTKLLSPFFNHIHVSLGLVTTLFLAADLKSYTHCNPPKSSAHLPSCNFIFCQPVMRICVMRLNFRISNPTMSLESGHDRERWVGAPWCKQHGHLGLAMKNPWLEPHSPFLLF